MNADYLKSWSAGLTVANRRQVYEEWYLRAIVKSYAEILQTPGTENEIRDRLYWHLRTQNAITKDLVEKGILNVAFEHWEAVSEDEKSRVDLTFFISGYFRFDVECKRLGHQWGSNQPYLDKGVERFIGSKYALESDHGAMLGFLISGAADTVFETLCLKVAEFKPPKVKRATRKPINGDWQFGFTSHHHRENGQSIQLYHLLLPFLN